MKLIYCIHSICNPGGMERVLWNKVTYWTRHTDWQILIVTTDQQARPAFYPFPEQVRCVDLGINYSDDNAKRPAGKILGYLKRRRIHRQRLKELLMRERADIVVSLYPSESSFIPDIRDGSKRCSNCTSASFSACNTAARECSGSSTGGGPGRTSASCGDSTGLSY